MRNDNSHNVMINWVNEEELMIVRLNAQRRRDLSKSKQ